MTWQNLAVDIAEEFGSAVFPDRVKERQGIYHRGIRPGALLLVNVCACGTAFEPTKGDHNRCSFCRPKPTTVTCACGMSFVAAKSTQRHCSHRCRWKARKRLDNERRGRERAARTLYNAVVEKPVAVTPPRPPVRCPCGTEFESRYPHARFCSTECSRQLKEKHEVWCRCGVYFWTFSPTAQYCSGACRAHACRLQRRRGT